MNKTNVLSALLIVIFMLSCLSFFNVSATEDQSEVTSAVTETTEVETTTEAPETTVPTTVPTTAATSTTVVTTAATVADPVYTQGTTKASESTTASEGIETNAFGGTKETKEINTTEETEVTTPEKNVPDYGSRYNPIKWLSLVVMIASVIALIIVNVRYRNKYGKSAKRKKPKLDTSARFTPPVVKDEEVKSEQIDLSSFSRKSNNNSDDVFGENNNDDDLYI